MTQLTNRCIWLIGASSGLGKALAEELVQAGNFVIISARSQDELTALALLYPGKIKSLPLDTSQKMNMQAAASGLQEITDYLDMVIFAAGICEYEDNMEFDIDIYARSLDVNFLGAVRILKIALPLLKKAQHKPHFAVISSLSTCVGFPRAEAYGASKAALDYFMKALRADFSKLNLNLSLIRPGFINTNLVKNNDFPMPFMLTPKAASNIIIKELAKQKFQIDFPLRLSWPLNLWGNFFGVWYKWIAPRLTRIHQW